MSDSAGGEPRTLDMVVTLHAEGATIPQDVDWLVAEAIRQRARADRAEAEVTQLQQLVARHHSITEMDELAWNQECPVCRKDDR